MLRLVTNRIMQIVVVERINEDECYIQKVVLPIDQEFLYTQGVVATRW